MHRSKAIDILRAVAIFLVLGRHAESLQSSDTSWITSFWTRFFNGWVCGGWVGVDLFFVLSGFLVSGLLFREHQRFGQLLWKDFLIRRGFKIYPTFWALIAVTVLVIRPPSFNAMKGIISELLFIQNYGPSVWAHTWSLAVEEHFYFILLIFLVILSRRPVAHPFRAIPWAFGVIAITLLGLRFAESIRVPYAHKTHLFPTHLRIDSLFCGVLISYLYHYHSASFLAWAKRWRVPALLLGIVALSPAFVFPLEKSFWIPTVGLSLFYFGSALILISSLTLPVGEGSVVRSLAFVGSHSYSIYIWHMPVSLWVMPAMERLIGVHLGGTVHFIAYVATSIGLGILLSLLLEIPVLKLRDLWFPSRARPMGTPLESSRGSSPVAESTRS